MKHLKLWIVPMASLLTIHSAFSCQTKTLNGACCPLKAPQKDWLVVGAGPAGIATVGTLLDVGIKPHHITWLDPAFNVGRMGDYYGKIPSNTMTKEFTAFINACNAFKGCSTESIAALKKINQNGHHELRVIINPLRDITAHLQKKVRAIKGSMTALTFADNRWTICTDSTAPLHAHSVVLATGSHPTMLNYAPQKVIPLDIALNPENLEHLLTPQDVVGVVGNSHSAILLLKFLSELPFELAHIYHLYRSPRSYATIVNGKEINGLQGLKGPTADWARTVLEKQPPAHLTSINITPETFASTLNKCTKIIYATGYQKNALPAINNTKRITASHAGIIGPRLFGIGIAFPEKVTDNCGVQGDCIGLSCFMDYAQRMIPLWVKEDNALQ